MTYPAIEPPDYKQCAYPQAAAVARAMQARVEAGETISDAEVVEAQNLQIRELKDALRECNIARERAESQLAALQRQQGVERAMMPSLEVLQRMANGLDPFDKGRFQCAVAALPHETPKLSASVATFRSLTIGDRMDRASGKFTVIEGGPDAA